MRVGALIVLFLVIAAGFIWLSRPAKPVRRETRITELAHGWLPQYVERSWFQDHWVDGPLKLSREEALEVIEQWHTEDEPEIVP